MRTLSRRAATCSLQPATLIEDIQPAACNPTKDPLQLIPLPSLSHLPSHLPPISLPSPSHLPPISPTPRAAIRTHKEFSSRSSDVLSGISSKSLSTTGTRMWECTFLGARPTRYCLPAQPCLPLSLRLSLPLSLRLSLPPSLSHSASPFLPPSLTPPLPSSLPLSLRLSLSCDVSLAHGRHRATEPTSCRMSAASSVRPYGASTLSPPSCSELSAPPAVLLLPSPPLHRLFSLLMPPSHCSSS